VMRVPASAMWLSRDIADNIWTGVSFNGQRAGKGLRGEKA
jgi:hypothetical protein